MMSNTIERFVINWMLIPLRLAKKFNKFIKSTRLSLLQQLTHIENQFLNFEIRKKKMNLIKKLLLDLEHIPTQKEIRKKGNYYYQIYLEWLKYRFQQRVVENGLPDFQKVLEIVGIEIKDSKLPLLLQIFSCIRCNREATQVKELQINPIRPALQGIQGYLHGLCLRYQNYSIFGIVDADPLYYYRRQLEPIIGLHQHSLPGIELLPTVSLRDLLIWEPQRLKTMLKRDQAKVKAYQTQPIDTLSTEFKFLPLGMKHRMIQLMIYGEQSNICRMLLGQIPEEESE